MNLGVRTATWPAPCWTCPRTASINDSLKVGKAVLGRLGTVNKLHRGQVEQANFAVLKAPDIPSHSGRDGLHLESGREARLNDGAYPDHARTEPSCAG